MGKNLYHNKYRIETARLKNWDYSSRGWYFITVITKNRENYFGKIINGEMFLSELGHQAAGAWIAMQRIFDVLVQDAWVIMPNHVHFLFGLRPKHFQLISKNQFGKMIKNSVSSIINHYKGRVTKYANAENINFGWHVRFYDHVVRDEKEFTKIRNYIINNPKNWDNDKFSR